LGARVLLERLPRPSNVDLDVSRSIHRCITNMEGVGMSADSKPRPVETIKKTLRLRGFIHLR